MTITCSVATAGCGGHALVLALDSGDISRECCNYSSTSSGSLAAHRASHSARVLGRRKLHECVRLAWHAIQAFGTHLFGSSMRTSASWPLAITRTRPAKMRSDTSQSPLRWPPDVRGAILYSAASLHTISVCSSSSSSAPILLTCVLRDTCVRCNQRPQSGEVLVELRKPHWSAGLRALPFSLLLELEEPK